MGAATGNSTDMVAGSGAAQNAVESNYLTVSQIKDWVSEIKACNSEAACNEIITKYEQLSIEQQDQLVMDCASDPVLCQQNYGHILSDSLLVKRALDEALGEDIPIKMSYDLTALFLHQLDAEGAVSSEQFALELQERYGLNVDEARTLATAATAALQGFKGATQKYTPNQGRVNNMPDFFNGSAFGALAKKNSVKTKERVQGQAVYRATDKLGKNIRTGDQFYLDGLHKDHIEVFDNTGKFRAVVNLDGTVNESKTRDGLKENRRLR